MSIEPKTELELLREQLAGCLDDLVWMGNPEGQSLLIRMNIEHKRQQAKDLEKRIAELEALEEGGESE